MSTSSKIRIVLVLALLFAVPLPACGPGDDGGACADLLPGDLVITEIFADHAAPADGSGEDAGKEWIEIYNTTDAAIDLEGLTLAISRLDGASDHSHTIGALTVSPHDYVVLGNVAPEFVAGHLDYGYGDDLRELFNTDGGTLAIRCGTASIDEASYGDATAGRSIGFDGGIAPDYTANDDATRWCATPEDAGFAFEDANYGTPGAANYDCPGGGDGMCDDHGTRRPAIAPVPGDLVITEVMPDPDGTTETPVADADGEWFEVLATAEIDLNGVELGRIGSTDLDVVVSSSCLHLTPGAYAIFARSTDANGGLPAPAATFSFGLTNSGGDVQIGIGGTALDSYAWTTGRAGKSLQLDAAVTTSTGNDDPLQWCDGATSYGVGDLGTPGAANASCGGSASTCIDPDTSAARAVVTPTAGQLTITEWMPNPEVVTDANGEWFEVHATADVDLDGLQAGATALGTTPIVPAGGTCHELAAGGYALFARKSDAGVNGMLPAVDGTFGFDLGNTTSNLRIGFGGAELDSKTAGAATASRSFQIDADGTQCVAPAGTAAYSTSSDGTKSDFGTPKAVHTVECQ